MVLFFSGCTAAPSEAERIELLLSGMEPAARVSQLVTLAVEPDQSTGEELAAAVLEAAGRGEIGGVWVEGGQASAVAGLTLALRSHVGVPLLVMADGDEGIGGDVRGASAFPPVHRLLSVADPNELAGVAEALAAEARILGIHTLFVRGPPTMGGAVYGGVRGDRLASGLSTLVTSAAENGLPLTVGLFWNPLASADRVSWDRARLEVIELPALRAAAEAGAAALMPGRLVVPALGGATSSVAHSPGATAVLRETEGWSRAIASDLRGRPNDAAPAAAVEAIVAGADLIVTDDASGAVAAALREAVSTGQISPRRLADATRRVLALKVAAILPAPLPPPPDSVEHALRHESHTALARRLASRLAAASPTPAAVVAQAGPSPADLQSVTANGLASATPTRSLEALPPDSVGMSSQGLAAVDRIIEEAIEEEVFTAAALALGRRGGLVRLTGYGSSDENGDPLDPGAALFDLASLTKVVGTTSAVAALIESGEMELDAPVRRWIGEFSGGEKDRVTIRHLLTHTSGLPPWLGLYASAGSPTEALSQVIEQSLVRPPGEISEYSDLGMILLAAVVERAAGMPIDQLLAERLFIPLDMASTMFLPPLAFRERAIPTATETERPFTLRGVVHDGNAYRLGGVTGHAGLFSTAHDLAIFSQMMLNGGSYGSVRIFSEPTVRAFTTAYAADAERGLGWDKPADRSSAGRFLSAASFGHTGFTGTSIWIDPARDLFVVLLTNRTFPEASAGDILEVRMDVHEAAAQAITDYRITARPEARR